MQHFYPISGIQSNVSFQTLIGNITMPGGGYSIGMDIHPDGTILSQVDIFGGYVGNTIVGTPWQQVATQTAMPSAYTTPPTPFLHGGLWAVRIAPSDSNTMYMMYLGNEAETALCTLLKSTNKGATWTSTGFPFFAGNLFDSTRAQQNCRIAIDPNNILNVWACTYTTLYFSGDGGTTFTQVNGGGSGLPAAISPGYVGMQFDAVTANRMIVGCSGSGIYVSTNANLGASSTWTLVTSSPTNPGFGQMASDGNYYANTTSGANTLYRVNTSGVLTSFSLPAFGNQFLHNFAIDPNNPARMIGLAYDENINGGPVNGSPSFNHTQQGHAVTNVSNQPWFHNASAGGEGDVGTKSYGKMYFDPFKTTSATSQVIDNTNAKTFNDLPTGLNLVASDLVRITNTGTPGNYMLRTVSSYSGTTLVTSTTGPAPGGYLGAATGGSGTFSAWTITKERVWVPTGVGLYYIDGWFSSAAMNWIPNSIGIEDMVAKSVIWPTGGNPVVAVSDRGAWKISSQPVGSSNGISGYGPQYSLGLIEGHGIDWASADPTFIGYAGSNFTGTNNNGGDPANWSAFTHGPPGGGVSGIAVASSTKMIAYTSTGLWYTLDGGATAWSQVPTVPTTGWAGAANTTGPQPRPICADRVNVGTFYAFSQTNSTVWKIVLNGGVTVTSQHVGSLSNQQIDLQARLAMTSNGHLFYSVGLSESAATYTNLGTVTAFVPSGHAFSRSTDLGVNWTAVANVQMCIFGFGAPKPGGVGYPSVYIAGWLNGNYGIYRSDDFDLFPNQTWTHVGTYARGWIDMPTCIEGDPNQWGRFIVGHYGSSFAIAEIASQPNTWP